MDDNGKQFEYFVRGINFDDNPDYNHRDKLEKDILAVLAKQTQQQETWRIIMKSPITKLAAAAVIIIAVALSIIFLNKSATPAYGITDLPELFEQARVMHIQGWQYFAGHRMPNGEKIQPVEIDNWIDLENGRSRYTGTGLSIDKDGVRVTIGETILAGQYEMYLNHNERDVTFFKISDYQRMLNMHYKLNLMGSQIFGDIEQLENFTRVGEETIDGIEYDIWEGEVVHSVTKYTWRYKYWLLPSTGVLGRLQAWTKVDNEQWELDYEYYRIDRDVDVPEWVFAMDVPEGYALKNTKETATPLELGGGGGCGYGDEQCVLSLKTRISFTMSDGSVILGWCSLDSKSQTPQEEFFEGLEFGGPLPELPVEIYGLRPGGITSDITYVGYHLACTQKAGKLTEWSVYVPDGRVPASVKQFGYDVLYRFNLGEHTPKWRIGYTVDHGILIETTKEFDKWVLGAMAELSDDGKAPEHVTYQNVLKLSNQLHEALSK